MDHLRAVTDFVSIAPAGPAVLTFRRAARRARFQAPVLFTPTGPADPDARP
ncbi:hypothetical protein [Streptomyces sp. NBC_01324]|uniref:hypothetical protein n=1 Tax=Streptomyces sp. NBC_01324 TaxID=2903826 RepID=UPI003FA37F9C